jgi:hypothetical protein
MKPIRRAEARDSYGPDPVLNIQSGAHLGITDQKVFEPKFHEETGALWTPALLLTQKVIDDGTEEGEADALTFSDRFEIKIDEDVRDRLGVEDDRALRNTTKSDFTKEQQALILDMDNWTIRSDTKLDMLMLCLYGKGWTEGKVDFDPDDLIGKEFIAKVTPKTGKKAGSYTEWNSYVSVNRPKKKRKLTESDGNRSDTIDLTEEELSEMEEAFPAKEAATQRS